MSVKLFITGTDTDVGKTYVSVGILNAFKKQKFSTLGIKPVSSGCVRNHGTLQNEDALRLQQASSIQLHYHQINPFAFEPAIAPHIAAHQIGREMLAAELKQKTQYALQYPADVCIAEGAGGWYVPLNRKETMADFIKLTSLKVVLVVGIRLGCINHTLLTYQAILQDKVPLIGWVANCVDPNMSALKENITFLQEWLPIPCLGVVEHGGRVEDAVDINRVLHC